MIFIFELEMPFIYSLIPLTISNKIIKNHILNNITLTTTLFESDIKIILFLKDFPSH